MLLLGIILNAALLSLIPVSAIPFGVNDINNPNISASSDLEVSERTLDATEAIRDLTSLRRRESDSSLSLIQLNQAHSSSSSTGKPKPLTDREIDCFPKKSRLSEAVAEDCQFIIDHMILGMHEPFQTRTWGFTDNVDINLSLPENHWIFQGCYIRVRNIDENRVDRFRPVDVAEQSQKIVLKCVVGAKYPMGGTADIGRLSIPVSFYISVAGTPKSSGENLGDSTALSLPSDRPHTLESRASLNLVQGNDISSAVTEGLEAGESYPVNCFDPSHAGHLKPAIATDCAIVLYEILPRLPNPMLERTFGYTDADDVNLSKKENSRWIFGQCAVFIRSIDTTSRDRFRFLDIAYTAQRIVAQCVDGSKYALGGTANVGTNSENFYVCVGGVSGPRQAERGNGTILALNPTQ